MGLSEYYALTSADANIYESGLVPLQSLSKFATTLLWIILADEPTGNLDLTTQEEVMDIFSRLANEENKCVIIVTHSPEVAGAVDEVYELASLRSKKKEKAGA